jgi:hypothetical protein
MPDNPRDRKLSASEAEQVLARAASLDAEGIDPGALTRDELRANAIAAGIAPHAVDVALRELNSPVAVVPAESGRFMGLPAITRAGATVHNAPERTPKEVAARLRGALGTEARITEELGVVRARLGHATLTVVPGPTTAVTVVADYSSDIAMTGIAGGAGGLLAGLFTTLALGFSSSIPVVLAAIPIGAGIGLGLWRAFWRTRLAEKVKEAGALANAAAAALGGR